jgi:hypothetical protein
MLQELCSALTMKIMDFGHPLYEAKCIAAMIVLQVVLLCALMGYTIRIVENGGVPCWLPRSASGANLSRRSSPAGMRGLIPATAGIAGASRRRYYRQH